MITLQTHIRKLLSPHRSIRLWGCEDLAFVRESSPEVILALEKAACDEVAEVAEAARYALRQDVHMEMAKKMGRSSAHWMLKMKRTNRN